MTPRLLLFAGPNGSGKSTLTTPEILAYYQIPLERYLNADDIARTLRETRPELPQEEREREAFREARQLRRFYREDRLSFAFETVFSHPSTLLDMRECRAAGFEVIVLFVTTENPEINAGRVEGRHRAGGHDVPVDRIHARYYRVMALLPRIIEDSDRATVFDNSAFPLLAFSFQKGKLLPSHDSLPDYLRAALLQPLQERQQERETLASHFSHLLLPDEAAGIYTGSLIEADSHYLLQQCQDTEGLIRHDRLMLTTNHELAEGQGIAISYKDGMGSVELL